MSGKSQITSFESSCLSAVNDDHFLLIMAGGKGLRWKINLVDDKGVFINKPLEIDNKLLAAINRQPLLFRTIDQLHHFGIKSPWIYNLDIKLPGGVRRFIPQNHREKLLDAILESRAYWDKPVTILLGDVVWSYEGLEHVLDAHSQALQFFGKLGRNEFTQKPFGEIYALRFSPEASRLLLTAIESIRTMPCWRKKLWELYRSVLGEKVPAERPSQQEIWNPPASRYFREIPDWTDDIDIVEEYVKLLQFFERQPDALREERLSSQF